MTKVLLPIIFVITLLAACSGSDKGPGQIQVEELGNRPSVPVFPDTAKEQDRKEVQARRRAAVLKLREAEAELDRLGCAFKANTNPNGVEVILHENPRLAEKARVVTAEQLMNAYSAFYIAAGEALQLHAVLHNEFTVVRLKQKLVFQINYPRVSDDLIWIEARLNTTLSKFGYRFALISVPDKWLLESTAPTFTDFVASRAELERNFQAYVALLARFPVELLSDITVESDDPWENADYFGDNEAPNRLKRIRQGPPSQDPYRREYEARSIAKDRRAQVALVQKFLARVATEQDFKEFRSELDNANQLEVEANLSKEVDAARTSFSQTEVELKGIGIVFVSDQKGRITIDTAARLKHLKERRFESRNSGSSVIVGLFEERGLSLKSLLEQTDGNAAEIAVIEEKISVLNDLKRAEGP